MAISLLSVLALLGDGCRGGGGAGGAVGPTTTDSTSPGELSFDTYSDPSAPITVDVGRRFAFLVPVDPADGWRWIVEPVDIAVLAPLGSEFREDPALLARATTTTTTTAPVQAPEGFNLPEQPAGDGQGDPTGPPEPTVTTPSSSSVPGSDAPTTVPGPLVQIISFAGRAPGTATVTLREEQLGSGGTGGRPGARVVFTVVVADLDAPPPFVEPPSEPPPSQPG